MQPYWLRWEYRADGSRSKQHQWQGGATVEATDYVHAEAGHPHRLTGADAPGTAQDITFLYNDDGSVAVRQAGSEFQAFGYGPDGALQAIWHPVNSLADHTSYVRDADGNVVMRKENGSATLYLPGQEVKVTDGTHKVDVTRYYDFDGTNIAIRENRGAAKYMVSDLNGSNQVAIDRVNDTIDRRYLDPYGNPLAPTVGSMGELPGSRSFLHKPVNELTGLVDMGARAYDPVTGQFMSVDPIVEGSSAQQAQGYTYANNNPITYADPSGLLFGRIAKAVTSVVKAVVNTAATTAKSTYNRYAAYTRAFKPYVAPVVDRVPSTVKSYSATVTTAVSTARTWTTSTVSSGWNATSSGVATVASATKSAAKTVQSTSSLVAKVAVASYNFAIGDMISTCSQGISLSCGAEIAMMTPWGKAAKAGKLAHKIAGNAMDARHAAKGVDEASALVRYDPTAASRNLLGQVGEGYARTPSGYTVSAHAAERIVSGAPGRSPTTLSRVDDILNNPTRTMMRPNGTVRVYQGKDWVAVRDNGPMHIVTVMVR